MRLVSFDGLTLGQAMAEDDIPLQFASSLQTLPGQAGAYDNYGTEQVRGPLTIRRSMHLVAAGGDDIGDLLDQLRAKANLGRRWLVVAMTDSSQRGIWAKLVNVQVAHGIEHLVYVPVTLTFQATWPWFEDVNDIWYLDAGRDLDDGFTFDSNYTNRSGAGALTITNSGGDVIRRGLIVIKGPSTNPSLSNSTNGYSISYAGAVATGSTLFIDIGAQSVTLPGVVNPWANITLGADQVGFFQLEKGQNDLVFAGGGTVEVHWAEVY